MAVGMPPARHMERMGLSLEWWDVFKASWRCLSFKMIYASIWAVKDISDVWSRILSGQRKAYARNLLEEADSGDGKRRCKMMTLFNCYIAQRHFKLGRESKTATQTKARQNWLGTRMLDNCRVKLRWAGRAPCAMAKAGKERALSVPRLVEHSEEGVHTLTTRKMKMDY